jgi:hypothetical protein
VTEFTVGENAVLVLTFSLSRKGAKSAQFTVWGKRWLGLKASGAGVTES